LVVMILPLESQPDSQPFRVSENPDKSTIKTIQIVMKSRLSAIIVICSNVFSDITLVYSI